MTRSIPPCASCPWRVSTRTEDIPGGGLEHELLDHFMPEEGIGKIMQCHLAPDYDPRACAGFMVRVGFQSTAVRIAHAVIGLDPNDYTDGGAELHPTFDAMLAAHPEAR